MKDKHTRPPAWCKDQRPWLLPEPLDGRTARKRPSYTPEAHPEGDPGRRSMLGFGVVVTPLSGATRRARSTNNWPRFFRSGSRSSRCRRPGSQGRHRELPDVFTRDEWPGGKNLAHSGHMAPNVLRDPKSKNFGLNYDPSHLVWQQMDIPEGIGELAPGSFTCTRRTCG